MKIAMTVRMISLCCVLLVGMAVAAEGVDSGLAAGAPTISIPVVDVTGAYKGKRICYVCEFQDDPNVLAFFRDTGDVTADLIVQLNDLYLRNKDKNFKAVAMIVAGADATQWLENLSQSENIEIPLTVFRKGPQDVAARLYELNPEVENTFLVTKNRFVVANVASVQSDSFGLVADAASEMLAQND